MLDPSLTVAGTVLSHAECAAVFQRHRIDFCCQGGRTIEAAAQDRGVDVTSLLDELEAAIAMRRPTGAPDPTKLSTPSLIAYLISRHHDYLRKTLPFVRGLSAKVARVHGARNPRLGELDAIVGKLADVLTPHLDAEEQTLFPALMAKVPDPATIATELAAMHADHLVIGGLLDRMRTAAEDYALPDWACTSYRTLVGELGGLEDDLLRHVHLENHALMPRFAAG